MTIFEVGVFTWGTGLGESSSLKHRIINSNQIAVLLFLLSLCLEVAYLVFYPIGIEAYAILFAGLLSLSTILINKAGYTKFSRYWLSISISTILLVASVFSKVQHHHLVDHEYDYFNYRIMIMAVSILPAILFSIAEFRSMLICFLVSIFFMVFYDPIHELFGVGNNAAIVADSHYYFSNVIINFNHQ